MEMTYGGALVMPSSYAMMDEEEMMYLEGGTNLDAGFVGVALDIVISLAIGGVTTAFTGYMKDLVSRFGKERAALHFGNVAKKYAIKYFGACVGVAAAGIITVALTAWSVITCPGTAIANYWACHDKDKSTKKIIEI